MGKPVPVDKLPKELQDPFETALKLENVSKKEEQFLRSIYQQESGGGKNIATTNQKAVGHMQIQPTTFESVAEKNWNINNPIHNIRAGFRYAKEMLQKAEGDFAAAAAGYYGGPKAIKAFVKGEAISDTKNPNAPNTLEYAQQVIDRMKGIKVKARPVPAHLLPKENSTSSGNSDEGFPAFHISPDFKKMLGFEEM